MSFFPNYVMPKRLVRESSSEVDGSPLIYNANDYNRHHREIRAIEQFLIGIAGSEASGFSGYFAVSGFSGFSGFSGESLSSSGLFGVVQEVDDVVSKIINDGLLTSIAGYVGANGQIPIPVDVTSAELYGPIGAADVTIPCDLAMLFPKRGYMTKFNAVMMTDHCTTNVESFSGSCSSGEIYKDYEPFVAFSGAISHVTNQEFIWYDARTDSSFGPCTRGADGTTSQDLAFDEVAIIVPGRASLMLSSYAWAKAGSQTTGSALSPGLSGFRQFVVAHKADLTVQAAGFSGANMDQIDAYYRVGYCLTVTPNFNDISLSSAYEG